jgi:hypothetical protein
MHLQIRAAPRRTDPGFRQLLEILDAAEVNVVAIGGGAFENGGSIAFSCHDEAGPDDTDKARRKLRAEGYRFDIVKSGANNKGYLHLGAMRNQRGQLMREVDKARRDAGPGFVVEDIAIGVPHSDELGEMIYPVQIFCVRAT